jgi:hypothetical protein
MADENYRQKFFDLKMTVRQLRLHEKSGAGENELFHEWRAKRNMLRSLVDKIVFEKEVIDELPDQKHDRSC